VIPPAVPEQKRAILERLVEELRQTAGVMAVVLGGSYARGTQRETSDLDIGIYYREEAPFAIPEIKRIATDISRQSEPVVTGFYEWGQWVNGGAWIQTDAGKVDFLYRNLDHVQRTIDEAHQGILRHDYGQQPAYGFYSVIYLAETQVCVPLVDPDGRIEALKRQVVTYPPRLKQSIVVESLWSAEFTLSHARSYAMLADVYNTVGCFTRVAASLTQALFALNETYFMTDKKVMGQIAAFPIVPAEYVPRLTQLLACPGEGAEALQKSVDGLESLWRAVVELAGGSYRPKFLLDPAE
jgi:hypothetical protein